MYVDNPMEAVFKPTATGSPGGLPSFFPDPIERQEGGDTGDRALWVVFVIMFLSSLAMYIMAWRVPTNKRFFHIITSLIVTFATISYYAMAVGDGISWHYGTRHKALKDPLPDQPYDFQREVYWARYADWAVTTPLLLLDLALLAGLNGANITVAIIADLIMILTGLFAALNNNDDSRGRWGYYAMGCAAYLVIVYQLAVGGRATVKGKDKKTAAFFTSIAGFTLILWTIYPIIWGMADGSYILDVDQEILAYAVLDVLAKPVFGFWLLFTHDSLAESSVSIEGFWTHGLAAEGGIRVGDDDGA